jgi:transcriptional regulator with XRE-family HTH domain
MAKRTELAVAIRAWRDRLRPEEVGLPAGGRRRASGLRREELAALAGMSVDYLVRLEQGRASHPSPPVLAALARALRLSAGERDLLYLSAGIAPPSPGVVPRHVSPGLQRILDRLADSPVGVFTAAWDLVLANPLWQALFGLSDDLVGRDANIVWRFFTGDQMAVVRTDQQYAAFAATLVRDLHAAVSRYPDDRDLAALVAELRASNDRFAELWADYRVAHHVSDRKTINSPAVGTVTVDCDVLAAPDTDLRIVVYTARPGTEDAGKLDLLRVAGSQV